MMLKGIAENLCTLKLIKNSAKVKEGETSNWMRWTILEAMTILKELMTKKDLKKKKRERLSRNLAVKQAIRGGRGMVLVKMMTTTQNIELIKHFHINNC